MTFNINKSNNDYSLDMKVVNNIKSLSIDIMNSNLKDNYSFSSAPIIYRLFSKHLVLDVSDNNYINRDRFIVSSGNNSSVIYSTLYMCGYDISLDDLKNNNLNAKNDFFHTVYDFSNLSLGEGFSMGVGFAIGEAYLNKKFKYSKNSLIDHYTYVLINDNDVESGLFYESCLIASHLNLGKLIVLYDTSVSSSNILKFNSFGWDTYSLSDPYDFGLFDEYINKAKSVSDKPSIIEIKSLKDSCFKNDIVSSDDIRKFKRKLGIRDVEFTVLSDAYSYMNSSFKDRCKLEVNKWHKNKEKGIPKLSRGLISDFNKLESGYLDIDFNKLSFKFDNFDTFYDMSSYIFDKFSNKDLICLLPDFDSLHYKKDKAFSYKDRLGKNIICDYKYNAISFIMNGINFMNLRCFTSMGVSNINSVISGIKVSSLFGLNPIYILFEDNDYDSLDRINSISNVIVFRPCDRNELFASFSYAFSSDYPVVIVLSKSNTSNFDVSDIKKTLDGGYVLLDNPLAKLNLISSGSDVFLAINICKSLEKHMIPSRVISMPSFSLFDCNKKSLQEKILPMDMRKVVLDKFYSNNYYKYLSSDDFVLNLNNYIYDDLNGFDEDKIVNYIISSFKENK